MGFRFDAEDSEDELDGVAIDDTLGLDGMQAEELIRVDWGRECSGGLLDDLDAGGTPAALGFDLAGDAGGLLVAEILPPAGDGLGAEHWKARAEAALVAKTNRETLAVLAVAPEAEHAPALRDKLLKRVADAVCLRIYNYPI